MMLDQFGESEGVHQLDVIIAKATGETIPVYDGPGPALVFDRPSAFSEVKLAPEPQCRCGHTELQHRIDKTCGKVPCLCIRFEVPEPQWTCDGCGQKCGPKDSVSFGTVHYCWECRERGVPYGEGKPRVPKEEPEFPVYYDTQGNEHAEL